MAGTFADFSLPFETKRRSAQQGRDATMAQNAYSRFLSQQRGTRDLADLERGMTAGVEGLGSGIARRGLRHSGIAQTATNDYASKWTQGRQDINDTLMNAMRGYEMSDQSAQASYLNTEADLQAQKQAQILATAAALQPFKSFLGG